MEGNRGMTESQAQYDIEVIAPEVLRAIRDVLTNGYGKVIVTVKDNKIVEVEKSMTEKVRCNS